MAKPDAALLIAKFKGRPKMPKNGDEGTPDMSDPRGMGPPSDDDTMGGETGGSDDMSGAPDDAGGSPDMDEQKATDDLSDILGVGPEDRADFGAALKAYVSACIAKTLGDSGSGGGSDVAGPGEMDQGAESNETEAGAGGY